MSTPGQFTRLQFKDSIQQGVDCDYLADVVRGVIEHEHSGRATGDMSLKSAEGGQQQADGRGFGSELSRGSRMGKLWGRVRAAVRFRVSCGGGAGCDEREAGMRAARAFTGMRQWVSPVSRGEFLGWKF